MARPSGVRTLAGYTLGDRLAQNLYGEVYRATDANTGKAGKKDVTLLVVDPKLAADDQFAEALARGTAPLLDAFHHRSVVGTIVVAQDGKSLVVVTEGSPGTVTLADVIERARGRSSGKLPGRVATAIARSIVDALATAHAAGIVHGALHPRSVLLDRDGNVRVTDFAVGNAAMTAAAAGSDAVSLKGLAGFLAPEQALGDEPSPASDVFAIGALLFSMLTGETPPGSLNTSAAIERLVQRALDTDLARRFANAVELQENLAEALEDDRWESAGAAELGRFVAEQSPSPETNLDAATEDLLASLSGGAVEVTRPTSAGMTPISGNGSGAGSGVSGIGSGLGDSGIEGMAQAHSRRPGSSRRELDSLLADLEDSSADGPLTVVDEPGSGQAARDPISELIALEAAEDAATNVHDPEHTPLPPPQPDEPGTLTREAQGSGPRSMPRRAEPAAPQTSRLVEKTRPKHKPEATPPPVLEPPKEESKAKPPPEPPRMKFVKPADDVADDVPVPSLKRSPIWTWLGLVIILAGGAALVFYLKKQGQELTAGEKAAKAERDKKEKEKDALEQRLRAAQADPGAIRVSSTPDGAAVWLLLGRTPFDSIALKTQAVWEMRVELDGQKTQDVRVGGAGWTGKPDDLRASIDVKLEPGTNDPPLPAMPPEPPASDRAGLVDGSGSLHATSKPEGAAVWLLVGVTNSMELSGIEAGQPYELRVTKDGFVPGYVRITGEEWREGGDPNLPLSAAPKREIIDKNVELVPATKKSP